MNAKRNKTRKRKFTRLFMGDLETSQNTLQKTAHVWASGIRELGHMGNDYQEFETIAHTTLNETLKYLSKLKCNALLYYHNLQFDGTYWIHALNESGYSQRCQYIQKGALDYLFACADDPRYTAEDVEELRQGMITYGAVPENELVKGEYTYLVDEAGKWFYITVKLKNGYVLEIRDSLKLFPMSVDAIGKATKYKMSNIDFTVNGRTLYEPKDGEALLKGSIDYEAPHEEGAPITDDEAVYLCKDLAIIGKTLSDYVREFNDGSINGVPLTIGQNALKIFKYLLWGRKDAENASGDPFETATVDIVFNQMFPNLTEAKLTKDELYIAMNNLKQDLSTQYQGNLVLNLITKEDGTIDEMMLYDDNTRMERCDEKEYQAISRLLPITQDAYIRGAYKGGWCYTNPKYKGMVLQANETEQALDDLLMNETLNALAYVEQYMKGGRIIKVGKMACSVGCTMDVNSLYPYVMSSMSGNKYAYGLGTFYQGDVPEHVKEAPDKYCVYSRKLIKLLGLKEGHFPCIQIKNSILYPSTEWLETTRFEDVDGYLYDNYEWDGSIHDTAVVLTMYETEWELVKESYELEIVEDLDCLVFNACENSLFDEYIERFAKMKIEAAKEGNGFKRLMAKLFLNNLYGKMATSIVSNVKTLYFDESGALKSDIHFQEDVSRAGYVAIGAAITANARCYTIKAANANFEYFAYADTDSIHCLCPPEMLKGIDVDWHDDGTFGQWKCENTWTTARFLGAKTYFEQMASDDPIIKACGAPNNCKEVFTLSMPKYQGLSDDELYSLERFEKLPFDCKCQIKEKRLSGEPLTVEDFDIGLVLHGKLLRVQLKGGCYLKPTTFEIRDRSNRNILKDLGVELSNKKDLRPTTQAHKPR